DHAHRERAGHVGAPAVSDMRRTGRIFDPEPIERVLEYLRERLEAPHFVRERPMFEELEDTEVLETRAERGGVRHTHIADDPEADPSVPEIPQAGLDVGRQLQRRLP